jgi:ABC-type Na+ efflux pump permease subunit
VANILLFVLLQIYGTWVLTGVTEEKSSRVVEVLLSSIRARDLLVGKLVGIGLVALLHGAVLAGTGVVAGLVTGASFLDQVDAAAVLPRSRGWSWATRSTAAPTPRPGRRCRGSRTPRAWRSRSSCRSSPPTSWGSR